MREFIKTEVGEFPYTRWMITDNHSGETISGGPIVAYFISEKDAQDYCDYRNRNLSKQLDIKNGKFKI